MGNEVITFTDVNDAPAVVVPTGPPTATVRT